MVNYIIRRVLQSIPQLFLISLVLFLLMQAFGDPIASLGVRTPPKAFMRLRALLQSQGGMLHVAGIKLPVQRRLESAGPMMRGPNFVTYRTDADAVAALKTTLSAP